MALPEDPPGPNKDTARWAQMVLDYARTKRGGRLSQQALGDLIGMSRNGLNKVLKGWSGMDSDTRAKLIAIAPPELKGGPEALVLRAPTPVEHPTKRGYEVPPGVIGVGGYVESSQSRIVGHELDSIEDESLRTDAMIKALAAIKETLAGAPRNPPGLGTSDRPDRSQQR